MKKIAGYNGGGELHTLEKGDRSPRRGRKYPSTSAFVANCRREHRPKQDAEQNREALRYLMEMTPQELTDVIRSNALPGSLCVEARGWLDAKRGPENMRKSMERVFGMPTERVELTGRDGLDLIKSKTDEELLAEIAEIAKICNNVEG